MIDVMPGLSIPEDELHFDASRSGGPGGQNVNKVSTRVTLTFDIRASVKFSEDQKRILLAKQTHRTNQHPILRVISQRTRSQDLNRTDAIERFSELLREALTLQRTRVKTRVPRAAHGRRVEQKKKRALIKQGRSKKILD